VTYRGTFGYVTGVLRDGEHIPPASVSRTTASYELSPALTVRTARTRPVRLDREAHRRLEFVPVGMAHAPPSEGPQTQPGEAEPAAILATPEVSTGYRRSRWVCVTYVGNQDHLRVWARQAGCV
jgi:hypothetical protein